MRQNFDTLEIRSARGPGLYDVTDGVQHFVAQSGVNDGLLTCFIRHTSASLVIQENADPDVLRDLEDFMRRTVSRDMNRYRHTTEGPDDMPAHIRAMLTQTSLSIPVRKGRALLGTWQAIYLFEHRDAPHDREIALHIIGE
ncbi:MAG TPA: secondary thiamine-phosphate synthase enzyme YjbQ [Rhizomicrobium sp.]|nr:secondary thiamine-phosphate synthase enzyme YjbQ [Rhizomicrobium sp.]